MSYGFEYLVPTKVVFGKEAEKRTGELIKEYGGTKVLIHYGSGSVIRTGVLDKVKASLDAAGVAYVELGGVVPNPHLSKIYEGIELCKKEGVDFILAVGGGSTIDSTKAISYGLCYDGDVWDLFDHKAQATGFMPIASVLTIAAAGSETSNSCVITNDLVSPMIKRFYDNEIARPRFTIMNPEFTMTLPDYQTASGATDIMMHTQERYFTATDTLELTDQIAEALLRNTMKYAKILAKDPQNYEARAEIMWAGSLSHNNLTGLGNGGGDFVSHMLEHELGALYDVAHGAGLAAVWSSWARYVCKYDNRRFVRYAKEVMGVEDQGSDEATALAGIAAMEDFYREIGMPTNLDELGVHPSDEDCRYLAKMAQLSCGGPMGGPKVCDEEDMYNIYKIAAGLA